MAYERISKAGRPSERGFRRPALWWRLLAVAGVVAGAASVVGYRAYREGPPPGFSGGFGEASCGACHFSAEDNSGPGTLEVFNLPESYGPGEHYELVVRLSREGMAASGFEMTARFAGDGAQAGALGAAGDAAHAVAVVTDRDVQYAYQTQEGSIPEEGVAEWRLTWRAPEAAGTVLIHVAANAADGDGTAEGDEVYVGEWTVRR